MRMRLGVFMLLLLAACKVHNSNDKVLNISDDNNWLKANDIQLSTARINIDSFFFKTSAEIAIGLGEPGSIRSYSLNEGPSRMYDDVIIVEESGYLQTWMSHKDFITSDTISQYFVKINDRLSSAQLALSSSAHENYPGNGVGSFTDHKKGSLDFRADNSWCGFDEEKIMVEIKLKKEQILEKLYLSILSDANSWIFTPAKISLQLNGGSWIEQSCKLTSENDMPSLKIIAIPFTRQEVSSLKVLIENMDEIPSWHPGAGSRPWLFIDEIVVE